MGPALLQGPLSRFGDTAANSGTLAILDEFKSTKDLPLGVKTAFASTAAAGWRIFLMRKLCTTFGISDTFVRCFEVALFVFYLIF